MKGWSRCANDSIWKCIYNLWCPHAYEHVAFQLLSLQGQVSLHCALPHSNSWLTLQPLLINAQLHNNFGNDELVGVCCEKDCADEVDCMVL